MTGISDDTGASSTDRITSDTTLVIKGVGTAGAVFQIRVDGTLATTAVVGARGTFEVPLTRALVNGTHTISLRPQGMNADTQAMQVTIDSRPPELLLGGQSHWLSYTPTLSLSSEMGTGRVAGAISIDVDRNDDGDFEDANEQDVVQVEALGGKQEVTLPTLPEGNWDVRARAQDLAGNRGVSNTFKVHIAMDLTPTSSPGSGTPDDHDQQPGPTSFGPLTFLQPPVGAMFDIPANETEPNDTLATAEPITIPIGNPVLLTGQAVEVTARLGTGQDEDWFSFFVVQRNGVFFDIDSLETNVSATCNTILELYDSSGTRLDSNDNGYDFDTGFPAQVNGSSFRTRDSSLYADLQPGTYFLRVRPFATNETGGYRLRMARDPVYGTQVPVLNSLPGATDTIFLDFNGYSGSISAGTVNLPAFDFSGNAAEFSPGERAFMRNVWRTVAEDFSPFRINVSTSYTGTFNDGQAMRVVINGDDGAGVPTSTSGGRGIAFQNSYTSAGAGDNVCFAFYPNFNSNNYGDGGGNSCDIMAKAIEVANEVSHQLGHTLGLQHYTTAMNPTALMDNFDIFLDRETWSSGTNAQGNPQDDEAIIASPTNTFGLRPDDHGNTRATARVLPLVGRVYRSSGSIKHITNDVDYFRFAAVGSGTTTITANVDDYLNDLDLVLVLYDSSGTPLGANNPTTTPDGTLSMVLSPGNYFAEVRSNGVAGSTGQYQLTITIPGSTPPGPGPGPVPTPTPTPPSPPPPPFTGGVYGADPFEPNNTSSAPFRMGALPPGGRLTYAGLTLHGPGNLPDYDWFRWMAAGSGTVWVTLFSAPGSGDLELSLWRRNGNSIQLLSANATPNTLARVVGYPVTQGTEIFVQVKGRTVAVVNGVPYIGRGRYTLEIKML